jgi:hypothetical protein
MSADDQNTVEQLAHVIAQAAMAQQALMEGQREYALRFIGHAKHAMDVLTISLGIPEPDLRLLREAAKNAVSKRLRK